MIAGTALDSHEASLPVWHTQSGLKPRSRSLETAKVGRSRLWGAKNAAKSDLGQMARIDLKGWAIAPPSDSKALGTNRVA